MADVARVLEATRVLTLTGVGGCGKTRLAVQTGAAVLDMFRDGVWLVELPPLSDPGLVVQAAATALGVGEQQDRPLLDSVVAFLAEKTLLLILDGCEHVLEAAAALTRALVAGCPVVRILATSREALGIDGELTYRVPPLSLPDPYGGFPPNALMRYESMRLLAERAKLAAPKFRVTAANADAAVRVCRRLDGIPLAIELAAARLATLSIEQIADRLDDRFQLLSGGGQAVLPRHQTLRAAMDWSYDLLSDPERAVLRRASVFAGGFSLDTAEAVCAGDGVASAEIRDLLIQLINRSLALSDTVAGETRYRLQETVRSYGRDRLLESGEHLAVRGRHREWYLALAERAEAELQGSEQRVWLARLEREHDNLRDALGFALDGPPNEAIRLAAALWWFWHTRGYLSEGRGWLAKALAAGPGDDPRARARALYGAGFLAWRQGEFDQAQTFGRESLNVARALGNALGMAAAISLLEQVARSQGHYARAAALPEQSLAMFRELGDTWGIATSLISVGNAARFQGNYGRAREALEESLELFRGMKDQSGTAAALHFLALVARDQRDYTRAEAAGQESVHLNLQIGDTSRVAFSLHALGLVARDQMDYDKAETLLQDSFDLFQEMQDSWGIAAALVSLGVLARHRGDFVRAAGLLREGIVLRKNLGDKVGIAECLEDLAAVAVRVSPERAARLLGAGEALRGSMGAQLPPSHRAHCEETADEALRRLGRAAFERAWSAGRRVDVEKAVHEALNLEVPASAAAER
jgi:predicted ATPase